MMDNLEEKPPLLITINGDPVGRIGGHDAHGTLIDDRAYDLGMDPEEYFDQSDLIYVGSGGEQLLFDARPELGKDNEEAAIKAYLKNSGILKAEMSFYGISERKIVENPLNTEIKANISG